MSATAYRWPSVLRRPEPAPEPDEEIQLVARLLRLRAAGIIGPIDGGRGCYRFGLMPPGAPRHASWKAQGVRGYVLSSLRTVIEQLESAHGLTGGEACPTPTHPAL